MARKFRRSQSGVFLWPGSRHTVHSSESNFELYRGVRERGSGQRGGRHIILFGLAISGNTRVQSLDYVMRLYIAPLDSRL